MHHDHDFAVNRNGTRDIFLNTPNQAAWFERFVTDWSGPRGRLGRMKFRMRGSVFPGDTMRFEGTVRTTAIDDHGCGWVELDVALMVDGDVKTECMARVALPTTPDDNPWARRAERWQP
jgi:acyl dehydratase